MPICQPVILPDSKDPLFSDPDAARYNAQRSNGLPIGPEPVDLQPEQSGPKKSLGSIIKSIIPKEFSEKDKDQDVEDWIDQMNRYMRVAQVDEALKVDLAAACLRGLAYKAWSRIEKMRRQRGQEVTLDFLYETLRTSYGQIFPEQRLRRKLKTAPWNNMPESSLPRRDS
jgi:hypothetical protein